MKLTILLNHFQSARLTTLAQEKQRTPENFLSAVIRKGLDVVENEHRQRNGTTAGVKRELDDADKVFIGKNLSLSDQRIAFARNCATDAIKNERLARAADYIKANWLSEEDGAIGIKFGLARPAVMRLRISMGLKRKRGWVSNHPSRKIMRAELGTKAGLEYALTRGGKTLTEIVREKKLLITLERARQLIGDMGLTADASRRTPLWYANRIGHPELADKAHLEKALALAGGKSALAAKLGITHMRLCTICDKVNIDTSLQKGHGEMVALSCSF